MKKITMIVAMCAMALVGCKKEDKYFMSADVDGKTFYTDTLKYDFYGTEIGLSCTKQKDNPLAIIIIGKRLINQDHFIFYIDSSYIGAGTYDLRASGNGCWYAAPYISEWRVSAADSASSGELVITSDSKGVIKGTFTMNIVQVQHFTDTVKRVTAGKFCMPITYQ